MKFHEQALSVSYLQGLFFHLKSLIFTAFSELFSHVLMCTIHPFMLINNALAKLSVRMA